MTVYFLTPDTVLPTGGVHKIYDFADALEGVGIGARVVHIKRNFRVPQSTSRTPVTHARQVLFRAGDLLVVPDFFAHLMQSLAPGVPKVVLVQGAYLMFAGGSLADLGRHQWERHMRDVVGAVVVSEDSRQLVAAAFPDLPVWRIRPGIDSALFHAHSPRRSRTLALMPRRGRANAETLLHLLDRRGALRGWRPDLIDGVRQEEVARRLRSAPFFLTFAQQEGFGLPAAEAMASGCVVIGFPAGGGREFFDPAYCYPVEEGDLLGFASVVESALEEWQHDPARLADMGRQAARVIASRYQPEQERQDVVAAFTLSLRRGAAIPHPETPLNPRGLLTLEQRMRAQGHRLVTGARRLRGS